MKKGVHVDNIQPALVLWQDVPATSWVNGAEQHLDGAEQHLDEEIANPSWIIYNVS